MSRKTYSAYGAHEATTDAARTAFAGQRCEADTGWYLLGQRPYSPTLRRFLAPDALSPFASGGINRYAYCSGDPINRIDPTGLAPWRFGLFSRMRAAVHAVIGGAAPAPPGGVDADMLMPNLVTAAVGGVADTVSIVSEILPTSMTSGRPKARGLLGPLGNEAASEGSGLPPMKRRKAPVEYFEEDPNIRRASGVQVLMGSAIPQSRLNPPRPYWSQVSAHWRSADHPRNERSRIFATDALTHAPDLDSLIDELRELGTESFTLYTGAHGHEFGENWDVEALTRIGSDRAVFDRSRLRAEAAAARFGIAVNVIDIGGWTSEQFRAAIAQDGTHAINTCFGIADSVVRHEFNLPLQTIYDSPPLPPPRP